jgi:hydrogenase maturation protein HypF
LLLDNHGSIIEGAPVETVAKKLEEGNIAAIKGLGGFHLSCNAMDRHAVNELRKRKQRDGKPFAMMCSDIQTIKKYAYVSEDERRVLESVRRPIVLLRKKEGCSIPQEVVPDTEYLGFMLPYTPIHYLIFKYLHLDILVMTSANISDNPIIYKNDDALLYLSKIADYFLLHNRDIKTRCDDSLVRVIDKKEYFLRRSRGYVPFPVKLKTDLKMILACGAEQKASFALSRDRYVFLSQHIGDMKNYETLEHYESQVENFKKLFKSELWCRNSSFLAGIQNYRFD